MVNIDLTPKGNPLHTRLLEQYGVKGVPTVVFLDKQGQECTSLRLVDYLPPEQLLPRMATLSKKWIKGGEVLKIKVFLNDPCGLTWKRLREIIPRLGEKYEIEVEATSKSKEEYQSEAYRASSLPAAPAVMVDDEVAGQGPGISEEKLEEIIRRHLGVAA